MANLCWLALFLDWVCLCTTLSDIDRTILGSRGQIGNGITVDLGIRPWKNTLLKQLTSNSDASEQPCFYSFVEMSGMILG